MQVCVRIEKLIQRQPTLQIMSFSTADKLDFD